MKLIPFDLIKAVAGAKVITRDGREVLGIRDMREFGSVMKSTMLCGVVSGQSELWDESGKHYGLIDNLDLYFAAPEPERRTIYLYERTPGDIKGSLARNHYLSGQGIEETPITQELRNGKWVVISDAEVQA